MSKRAKAKNDEEVRDLFLDLLHGIADDWARQPYKTEQERCDGVIHSILALIDGMTVGFPAVALHVAPQPSDKEYLQAQGEDWFEPGMEFNQFSLCGMWYDVNPASLYPPPKWTVDEHVTAFREKKIKGTSDTVNLFEGLPEAWKHAEGPDWNAICRIANTYRNAIEKITLLQDELREIKAQKEGRLF